MPLAVDCPNCGEHIELFVQKGQEHAHKHTVPAEPIADVITSAPMAGPVQFPSNASEIGTKDV